MAIETAQRVLPRYGHRFSRKDFTLPQLFACLVLRKFYKTDYRGIVAILEDCSDLRKELGLTKTPHFTTLQKNEHRLLTDKLACSPKPDPSVMRVSTGKYAQETFYVRQQKKQTEAAQA